MADETTTRAPSNPIDFSAPATSAPAAAASTAICTRCATTIGGYYYESAGAVYCPKCKRLGEEASGAGGSGGGGGVGRAALYGLGAAIVGAAGYWAFIKVTNLEWAVVSVAVAMLVATAIRKGNGQQGGRRFQILAVVLTYLAIGGAYVPFFVEASSKVRARHDASAATAGPSDASSVTPAAPIAADSASPNEPTVAATRAEAAPARAASAKARKASPLTAIPLALGAVVMLALAAPVLIIVGGMPMSIINVAIIGFALRRAWQMLAADVCVVAPTFTGPYSVRSRPATSVGG